jgi:3-deoxy-D-manno-octulosonic-acid transferase
MSGGNVLPVLAFLYRLAWRVARPLSAPLSQAGGKLGRALRGRRGAVPALAAWAATGRDARAPLVWFHAASVGEGRQAEAVLVRVRAARPAWQIAFTYASPSAAAWAATLPVDVAGYIPFDTPRDTGRALAALRPAALVFSATDVWPELVRQAAARRVALGLVSALLAPTSSRRGAVAARLLRPTYAALDRVGAADDSDAARLAGLGVARERLVVTGDTRHDAARERLAAVPADAPQLGALRREPPDPRPIVVAGSTWPDDERALLPALVAARRRGACFRLVIAPHEPTPGHLDALERRLRHGLEPGITLVRLSSLLTSGNRQPLPPATLPSGNQSSGSGNWDVVLVDVVGVLAELYTVAALAFVGGGFHGKGLHSVIEPAAAGVPVLFGPAWRSSRDARLLLEAGGAVTAGDSAALCTAVVHWLTDETARASAALAARAVVERGRGAADRSAQLVIDLVERSLHPTP